MHSLDKKLILALLLLFPLFPSCDEIDEFPAEVSLNLEMQSDGIDDLSVSEGDFSIYEIKIEAEKENGEKIILQQMLDDQQYSLSTGETENLFSFNLPPAIYNYIHIELDLKPNTNRPTLKLEGIFKNSNMPQDVPARLLFEYDARENVKLNVSKPNGTINEIVLLKDDNKEINIKVDVGQWFQNIGRGQLIAADKIPVNGHGTVVINKNNNADLYTSISTRIQQSFSASL